MSSHQARSKPVPRDEAREWRITDQVVVDAYGPEEQGVGWYYYLEERIAFPFAAVCDAARQISALRVGDEVEALAMASEEECEREMFVLTRRGHHACDALAVPLSQLDPAPAATKRRAKQSPTGATGQHAATSSEPAPGIEPGTRRMRCPIRHDRRVSCAIISVCGTGTGAIRLRCGFVLIWRWSAPLVLETDNDRLSALLRQAGIDPEPVVVHHRRERGSARSTDAGARSGSASDLGTVTADSPAEVKLALFRRRFRGREDVHARRWVSRAGRVGWSPAEADPFDKSLPDSARTFFPLTDQALVQHLSRRDGVSDRDDVHVGLYPLLADDRCHFVVADFDGKTARTGEVMLPCSTRPVGETALRRTWRSAGPVSAPTRGSSSTPR